MERVISTTLMRAIEAEQRAVISIEMPLIMIDCDEITAYINWMKIRYGKGLIITRQYLKISDQEDVLNLDYDPNADTENWMLLFSSKVPSQAACQGIKWIFTTIPLCSNPMWISLMVNNTIHFVNSRYSDVYMQHITAARTNSYTFQHLTTPWNSPGLSIEVMVNGKFASTAGQIYNVRGSLSGMTKVVKNRIINNNMDCPICWDAIVEIGYLWKCCSGILCVSCAEHINTNCPLCRAKNAYIDASMVSVNLRHTDLSASTIIKRFIGLKKWAIPTMDPVTKPLGLSGSNLNLQCDIKSSVEWNHRGDIVCMGFDWMPVTMRNNVLYCDIRNPDNLPITASTVIVRYKSLKPGDIRITDVITSIIECRRANTIRIVIV